MKQRLFWMMLLVLGLLLAGPLVEAAQACPLCKEAIAEDDNQPRAYMYSILFMLSVPMMLVAGFGIGFYRLSKMPPEPDAELHHLTSGQ